LQDLRLSARSIGGFPLECPRRSAPSCRWRLNAIRPDALARRPFELARHLLCRLCPSAMLVRTGL